MRRNRMRSYTIDAEDEEDFIKEYEKAQRSRLSRINFEEKENDRISEVDEDEHLSPKKIKKISYNYNDLEEDEYSGLGVINNDMMMKNYLIKNMMIRI